MAGGDVLASGLRVLGRGIREQPRAFAVAVAGSVVYSLLTIATARVVGAVVGRVVVPAFDAGRVDVAALASGGCAIMAVAVAKVAAVFARRLGAGAMQFNLQARYRAAVVRRYLDVSLTWHQRHPTGVLLAHANTDVEAAFAPFAPLPFAVGTAVMLVAAVGSLLLIDVYLAVVGAGLLLALSGVNVWYSRTVAPRAARVQRLRAEVSAVAHESFDGALVIKTMGGEGLEEERFAARTRDLRDAAISVGRVRGFFDPLMDALPSFATLAALLVGTVRLRAGAVDVADVVTVAFLFTVLAFPVRAFGWVLAELPRSVAGWQRVRQVLTAGPDTAYGEATLTGTGPVTLVMDGVSYAYPGGAQVLHDVTFTVPAGRTVALVGPTGSGKSTIVALAARLVDPDQGTVLLDGCPAADLSAASLARAVALVPQVPFVFDDTIHGNVALDRAEVTDQRVATALEHSRLDDVVQALPQGPHTRVGERGATLSGGQRQRLALARGLAGRPGLLILEDATSAVDPRVEREMLSQVRALAERTTVLLVAYRPATIALADEVVYVERGRVVARGTHDDLLAGVPSYADLVEAYQRDQDPDASDVWDEALA